MDETAHFSLRGHRLTGRRDAGFGQRRKSIETVTHIRAVPHTISMDCETQLAVIGMLCMDSKAHFLQPGTYRTE